MRIIILMLMLLIASPSWAVQWDKLLPATTDTRVNWPTQSQGNNESIDRLLSNYREGITLSYSSTSAVGVSAGEIMVSNAGGTIRLMLKNAAAGSIGWSDIDTGAEATSTTYYIYALASSSSATDATFKISASSSAPSGATYYKRIGSFYNDASGNITQIVNDNLRQVRSAESKSISATYQALTDGDVVLNLVCANLGNATVAIYSDNSSSPSTKLASTSCQYCSSCGTGVWLVESGVSVKVKAGDYYKTQVITSSNTYTPAVYFIPTN